MDTPILYSPFQHAHLIPELVRVHAACITSPPYTTATFRPPLSGKMDKMTAFWTARAEEVAAGSRLIAMQMGRTEEGKEELAGFVSLLLPESETGPYRGSVEKLLVDPGW